MMTKLLFMYFLHTNKGLIPPFMISAPKRPAVQKLGPPKKKSTLSVVNAAIRAMSTMPVFPEIPKIHPSPMLDDVNISFGHTIGLTLRGMPPIVAARLRAKISAMVFEAEEMLLQ